MMVVGAVRKIVLLIALLFVIAKSNAENISYYIKLGGFRIGTLYATHLKKNDIDYYTIISDVEVNLIFKIKIYYKTVTVFKNSKLINSKVSSIVNGSNYLSSTIWDGHKYKIDCNSYKYVYTDSSRKEPIYWSVSKMYFDKPLVGAEVYAETYGRLSPLIEEKNNQLQFSIPKSKQVYYYDEKGLLSRIEMINSIKNFDIIKSDEKN